VALVGVNVPVLLSLPSVLDVVRQSLTDCERLQVDGRHDAHVRDQWS
jgi:hypothetical protein